MMMPISERIMKGKVICTSPTMTPKILYISGSGSEMKPRRKSMPLTRPLSPSSTIKP
ncbi:hypothetical protein D3C71_1482680 [compost metagenome]